MLESRDLRKTSNRRKILGLFLDTTIAMSEREIEDRLENSCDRVTIYRTLHTFLNHGLVHKVLDSQGSTKYALCRHEGKAEGKHFHNHIHFTCQNCQRTFCVEQVEIPVMKLPDGFLVHEVNVLYEGTCPDCNG